MPLITQSISKDTLELYSGYDQQAVGLGIINPNIYATPEYARKKVGNLVLGGISEIVYSGFEHDREPMFLCAGYIQQYNAVVGYNLHYCPPKMRSAILKFVLDSNAARIRSNQPIMIDYHALKRAIPDSQYIYRMLKIVGIRVIETIPLVEWPEVVKDRSKWEGHYRMIKEGKAR